MSENTQPQSATPAACVLDRPVGPQRHSGANVCAAETGGFVAIGDYLALKSAAELLADGLAEAGAEICRLRTAAIEVIEFNRRHANDQYGDADKCETWACVRTLRAALGPNQN